jgi:peptidoglycan/LPS O-acetylase OafA/YrhL
VAVACFFIVSGFYMAMVINEKYAKTDGKSWISTFYLARFFRLYPLYFVMATVMAIWFALTVSPNAFTSILPIPIEQQFAIAALNIVVIGQDLYEAVCQGTAQHSMPGFMASLREFLGPNFFNEQYMLVGQAWSLSSEFLFYLIAPFVVRSPVKTAIAFGVGVAIRFWLIYIHGYRSGIWGYWFFPGSACLFFLGSLGYHLHKKIKIPIRDDRIGRIAIIGFGVWLLTNVIAFHVAMASDATGSIDGP